MPALRQASMSSVPAGAVSFFPSTVKVTSGIRVLRRKLQGAFQRVVELPATQRNSWRFPRQAPAKNRRRWSRVEEWDRDRSPSIRGGLRLPPGSAAGFRPALARRQSSLECPGQRLRSFAFRVRKPREIAVSSFPFDSVKPADEALEKIPTTLNIPGRKAELIPAIERIEIRRHSGI